MAKHKKPVEDMSVEELRIEAAIRGIEGRSGMDKAELVAALKGTPPPPEPLTFQGGIMTNVNAPPPGPSDNAGEKTDNIPPSKRLPPDVPLSVLAEAVVDDELTRLRAENTALAQVVRNLGGNPEEVAKQATVHLVKQQVAAAGPTRTATVTPVGGKPIQVAFPADAKDPHTAAIEAYKQTAGLWSLPAQPHVDLDGANGSQ